MSVLRLTYTHYAMLCSGIYSGLRSLCFRSDRVLVIQFGNRSLDTCMASFVCLCWSCLVHGYDDSTDGFCMLDFFYRSILRRQQCLRA